MTDAPKEKMIWKDREFHLTEIAYGDIMDAYKLGGIDGMHHILMKSARYIEDNKMVFPSIQHIRSVPARMGREIMRLATEASKINRATDDDDGTDDNGGAPLA